MKEPQTTQFVYEVVCSFWQDNNYAPGLRDIMYLASLSSTSVAKYHVDKLVRAGRLRQTKNIARSIHPAHMTVSIESLE